MKAPKQVATTASSACLEASGLPDACNLPADFATEYGHSGLYAQGANGRGQTLGIITFASVESRRTAVLLEEHRRRQAHPGR